MGGVTSQDPLPVLSIAAMQLTPSTLAWTAPIGTGVGALGFAAEITATEMADGLKITAGSSVAVTTGAVAQYVPTGCVGAVYKKLIGDSATNGVGLVESCRLAIVCSSESPVNAPQYVGLLPAVKIVRSP